MVGISRKSKRAFKKLIMQNIESIQKGTGEEAIQYFVGSHNSKYYVDRIDCNWVDKEQTFDTGVMLTYTIQLEYQGPPHFRR